MLTEPGLVGRAEELKKLQLCLDEVSQGQGTTVFISGEAGSGKTRIATEFLNTSREKGITVLAGWCLSNSSVPFFPFVEAFESFSLCAKDESQTSASQHLALKFELLGNLISDKENHFVTPLSWKDHVFATVTRELLLIANNNPVILFIDDLHWADSVSLALLQYMARNILSERVLILATFRTEELNGQTNPLQDTLLLMGREDLFQEVKLSNFDKTQVIEIAESMLHGRLDPSFAEKLTMESEGNPLFIVEALRLLSEQGNLKEKQGVWYIDREHLVLPKKIKDLILRRVSKLLPVEREILDAASVIGDKFDEELLGAVLETDSLKILQSLSSIAHSNSLICCENNVFRFDHSKTRQTIYDEIYAPLKIGYHARVAQKIETNASKGSIRLNELTYHYAKAENIDKSIEYALIAGQDSLSRFSNLEAIKHFTYVLQTTSHSPRYQEQKEDALEGLGDALYANGSYAQAIKTFEHLAEISDDKTKQRALRKAMDAAFFQNNVKHLEELVKKAENCLSTNRLETARILINKARVNQVFDFKPNIAIKNQQSALSTFEEEYSLWDTAWALLGTGSTLSQYLDNYEQGLADILRAIAMFKELDDQRWLGRAYLRAGYIFADLFFHDQAIETLTNAANIFKKIGDYGMLSESYATWSIAFEKIGKNQEATLKAKEALEFSKTTDSNWSASMAYSALTRLYAKLECPQRAQQAYEQLLSLPEKALLNTNVYFKLTQAIFFGLKNEWEKANQSFFEYCASVAIFKDVDCQPDVQATYAWILEKQGKNEQATKHMERVIAAKESFRKRFETAVPQANMMIPQIMKVDKPSVLRIDIINVSRNAFLVSKIFDLDQHRFKISMDNHNVNADSFSVEREIQPFTVETVKMTITPKEAGNFTFYPKIVYFNNLGERKTIKLKSIDIKVEPPDNSELQTPIKDIPLIVFQSEATEKAFNYLITAFRQDFCLTKKELEKSGWRTLMQIATQGNISKHSIYGSTNHKGKVITELKQLHLVEVKFSSGERGRGGNILKMRVDPKNPAIRSRLEN